MKNPTILSYLLITILLYSCQRSLDFDEPVVYDIFPVIGQSNANSGRGLDYKLDKTDYRIKQLGRFGINDHQIIKAIDPLEHFTKQDSCNGFAMTFALMFQQNYGQRGHEVLLIPCAESGSSFRFNRWNRGDTLYNDVVERVKYVLKKYPGSEVKGFLWHQGESDIYWGRDYKNKLDPMINAMRRDIAGTRGDSIPFILGGMEPYWVEKLQGRVTIDSIIKETPRRVPFAAYADPKEPFTINRPANIDDEIHFDAAGQRELGRRYFDAYNKLRR